MCKTFPEFLSFLYFSDDKIVVDKQEKDTEKFRPETFNNLTVANDYFGELNPTLGMTRQHGRLGLQHVHVVQFSQLSDSSLQLLKRLRSLSHPNLLKPLYLAKTSSKM